MLAWQPNTPIIVRVVETPVKELGVADVIINALGITGILVLGAALLGLLLGGLLIWLHNARPRNAFNGDTSEAIRLKL